MGTVDAYSTWGLTNVLFANSLTASFGFNMSFNDTEGPVCFSTDTVYTRLNLGRLFHLGIWHYLQFPIPGHGGYTATRVVALLL